MAVHDPAGKSGAPQEDLPQVEVLAAVIRDNDRYLLCRRPRHKRHGGLWEFPGGKLEPGETLLDAARREMKEELDLDVLAVGEPVFARRDGTSAFVIVFAPVQVRGAPRAIEHEEVRWVTAHEGSALELAPSDRVFWERWVVGGEPNRTTEAG